MDHKSYIVIKQSVCMSVSVFLLLFVCFFSGLCPAVAFAAEAQSDSAQTDNAQTGNVQTDNTQTGNTQTQYYINDLGKLLTWDEDWALEKKAASTADTYGCGVYVLTVTDEMQGSADIFDYAEWFYVNYGLGTGENKNGALLAVNGESRLFATYFYGETADNAFDRYGQEKLEDYFLDDLHNSEWQKAMDGFITGCGEYLRLASEGHPVRRSPAGMIAICIGGSCLVSLLICLMLRKKMKSVHIGTGAYNYVLGGIQLEEQRDQYTHTTQERTRIEKDDDSGTSSSARSGSSGGSGRSGSF